MKPIDKSKPTRIIDTENTVDKSRSIPGTNFSNISTIIEKPTAIDNFKENKDIYYLSLPGDDWAGIAPGIPMLSLLGTIYRLPLFHMAERFIFLNEIKQRINEFTIGYMINPGLNVNKVII